MRFHGFPWHRLYVHLIQVIKNFTTVFVMRAGVLWSGELHPGILPLSRYGDRVATILPSVLPATHLHVCREGSTDLSRIKNGIASVPGNVTYPTRNFATLGPSIYCC